MVELDTVIFYNNFVKQFNISVPTDWNIYKQVSTVVFHDWRYHGRLFSKTYRAQTDYRDLAMGELEKKIESGT